MIKKIFSHLINSLRIKKFRKHGKNIRIGGNPNIFYSNVECGNDIYIGPNAMFLCHLATIRIGDHVIFGPNVTIATGNHRTDYVGKWIDQVGGSDKLPENDQPVTFVGDNWIGANATILKGVTINKGAIIGAGSVVTKDVPAYSIVVGNPARVVKMRFTEEQIKEHERLLQEKSNQ